MKTLIIQPEALKQLRRIPDTRCYYREMRRVKVISLVR